MSIQKVIRPLANATRILRNTKGYRHIKGYDYHGVPTWEWKFWRMRDKIMWIFHLATRGK